MMFCILCVTVVLGFGVYYLIGKTSSAAACKDLLHGFCQLFVKKNSLRCTSWQKPKPFIKIGQDGNLEVDTETLDCLDKESRPLVVISIIGPYRTGKSFLINFLTNYRIGSWWVNLKVLMSTYPISQWWKKVCFFVNQQKLDPKNGFDLGHTTQTHTRGIWAWLIDHPHRPNTALLLLDTEGIGAVTGCASQPNEQQTHDTKIVALGMILSSTLIYNCLGAIKQTDVDLLRYVCNFALNLKEEAREEQGIFNNISAEDFYKFLSTFVWAARDFHFDLRDADGNKMDEDSYLKAALSSDLYNNLETCFPEHYCFTFPPPCLDLRSLQNISPEFLAVGEKFKEHIFDVAQPKSLCGNCIEGNQFTYLAQCYLNSINNGRVPSISHLNTMVEQEITKSMVQCELQYDEKLSEFNLPIEEQHLTDVHNHAMETVLHQFENSPYVNQEHHQRLEKTLTDKYTHIRKRNDSVSRHKCEALLDNLSAVVKDKIQDEQYSIPGGYDKYLDDMGIIKAGYYNAEHRQSLGPKFEEVFELFEHQMSRVKQNIQQQDTAFAIKKANIKAKLEEVISKTKTNLEKYMNAKQCWEDNRQQAIRFLTESEDQLINLRWHVRNANFAGSSAGITATGLGVAALCTFWFPPLSLGLGIAAGGVGAAGGIMNFTSTMVEKATIKEKQKQMEEIFEKDKIFCEDWVESFRDLQLDLIPLGRMIKYDRPNDKRFWDEVLPNADNAWKSLIADYVKCKPVERQSPEGLEAGDAGGNLAVVRGVGQIAAGIGGAAVDIVDVATDFLPTAVRGVSKVAIVGVALAPVSLGLDIYNIVKQAKSKSEMSDKIKEYITDLRENLKVNRSLPSVNLQVQIQNLDAMADAL